MNNSIPVQSKSVQAYFPWRTEPVTLKPGSELLNVRFGQVTFDAEGTELPGRFFSRHMTWPGGYSSGVTIGRGYDMGRRTLLQIQRELTWAGMDPREASYLSASAGLRGDAAREFVHNRLGKSPIMSLEVQKKLFEEITTPETIQDIKRILKKSDVIAEYGFVDWDDLPLRIKELLFDLRYRGDYTPFTRRIIQPLLVNHDWSALKRVIGDNALWSRIGVPAARIRERQRLVVDY